MAEHLPVWCPECSPVALKASTLAKAEEFMGIWAGCPQCDDMCGVCYDTLRGTEFPRLEVTYVSWATFISCLTQAVPEGVELVETTTVLDDLNTYEVVYREFNELVGLDTPAMDTVHFEGGGYRESDSHREQPQLLWPLDVPYKEQFLTRMAQVMGDGAHKYEARNWERFEDSVTLERAKASASRHFNAWLSGDESEDHAAAAAINLLFAETIKYKIANKE
jgi:hypothetical protein